MKSLTNLLQELEREWCDPSVTGGKIAALGKDVVSDLLLLLKNGNDEIRWRIPSIFTQMKLDLDTYKAIVQHLISALENDTNANVRSAAALYVSSFKFESQTIIPTLLHHFIYDIDVMVRVRCGESLTYLKAEAAIPAFIDGLRDKEKLIRSISVKGLGEHSQKVELLDELIPMLFDSPSVRISVIEALGNFGPKAKSALPLLDELLKKAYRDKKRTVYEKVERTLSKIMN